MYKKRNRFNFVMREKKVKQEVHLHRVFEGKKRNSYLSRIILTSLLLYCKNTRLQNRGKLHYGVQLC